MSTTDDTNAARRGSGSNDLLGQDSEARWYCLDRDGVAMLCKDEADARAQVIENDDCWPGRAPHRAVLLIEANAADAHIQMARLIELETAEHERDILRTDNAKLHREAYTWSKAAETYAADAERLRAALRQLVDVEDMRLRLRQLHEMGHGTDYTDYHRLLPLAWAVARDALGPNVF